MISQYNTAALSPDQIASGLDARFQVKARVSLAIAVLAFALLIAVFCLIKLASMKLGMRPFMDHYHDLVLLSQGHRIPYTSQDWLSVLGLICRTVLEVYLCSKVVPLTERYLAERKAAKSLNRWLTDSVAATSTIHVPGMSSRADMQVIAMSCTLNAGRGVVDAVCLDEHGRPVLMTGVVDKQEPVKTYRSHDHYLIQGALNCHFSSERHSLARVLNLQPEGKFAYSYGDQLSGAFQ